MADIDGLVYLHTPEHLDELAARIRAAGVCGLDSEYHGYDWATGTPQELDDDKSPVGRTKIHVWSVAVPTTHWHPLGYRRTGAWVLPASALLHPGLRAALENPDVIKAVHNQSVDQHAFANHGVRLRGAINTLGLVRWIRPDLINQPGRFKLKALMSTLLNREPVCTFKELVEFDRIEQVLVERKFKFAHCSCGELGCRKRKGHTRTAMVGVEAVLKPKRVRGRYPLWEILPGHERWELLLKYAAEDAVAAMNVLDLCETFREEIGDPAPWPYGGSRPEFSQEVEEAIIEMESVGFRVDVPYCVETSTRAAADEAATLTKLFKWYVWNAPHHGPHRREDVDPIWSSGVQKIALFDSLGFPRSPIWKKGRVKRGKWCLDGTAMGWIAKNHPAAKQVADLLLHLQRIRSGKKYLDKLAASSGVVHPICGPAGDEDDRAGAVTGRLGIKGELEAQQLPKEGDKDLYEIRKAIVA